MSGEELDYEELDYYLVYGHVRETGFGG